MNIFALDTPRLNITKYLRHIFLPSVFKPLTNALRSPLDESAIAGNRGRKRA